jgi:phage recombination protein Bet
MTNEIVKYLATGGDIELSPEIIKSQLVPADSKITDQELGFFLQLCKYQKLNPFLREIYIVKYGDYPAAFIVGKDTFLRRAKRDSTYLGHTVGISDDGKDAWAEVHVKGLKVPIRVDVEFDEYVGTKSDGSTNAMWTKKPKTMLKKVALVQALREAFPDSLGQMYDEVEIDKDQELVDVIANEVKTAGSKSEQETTEEKPSDSSESGASASGDSNATPAPVHGERLEILSKIKGVTKKKGGTTDKPWTKFTLETVGGSFYTTFDEVYATEALKIKGKDVEALIIYDVVVKGDQTYYNLAPNKDNKQEGFTITG